MVKCLERRRTIPGSAESQASNTKLNRQTLFHDEDISRSLLYAISNNIGQIAYLQAQKHSIEHIYFGGSYIRGHPQTMHTISFAINFWSQGEKKPYFLRHEGYLGAVGAFLNNGRSRIGLDKGEQNISVIDRENKYTVEISMGGECTILYNIIGRGYTNKC